MTLNPSTPWLSIILALPLAAAVLLQFVPRTSRRFIRAYTIVATLIVAVLVGFVVAALNQAPVSAGPIGFRFQEQHDWIPAIGASYHLGIDGMAAWMLALNAAVFLLGALVVSWKSEERLKVFCTLLLITEAATAGVLVSADLLLFYLFWEGMLIPLYFMLATFGTRKRGPATLKFVIYTVAGSLLMLLSIIYLQINSGGSFDFATVLEHSGSLPNSFIHIDVGFIHFTTLTPSQFAFLGFAIAFAIKVPLVPFHTWLPDLYESCPTAALVFFAGIVSKLGIFGFIRYCLPIFAGAVHDFQWLLLVLAIISIIYGALMALAEVDLKRIVAYASISHLGFVALGVFSLTVNGINGAILQMVNHGIIIAALFLVVGYIEERTGTRNRHELAGLERRMPWLYFFFLVITLAGLGMPGMNSFAGEFSIMLGAFQAAWFLAVLAGVGVILACWYMLRLHQGLMHEPLARNAEGITDIRISQGLVLLPLVAVMIGVGLYPKPIGDVSNSTAAQYCAAAHSSNCTLGAQ